MTKVVEDKVIKGKTYRLVKGWKCDDCAGGDNLERGNRGLCTKLGNYCIANSDHAWVEVEDE